VSCVFVVNTTFITWPSFVHPTLLRLWNSEATSADVSSLLSVFIIYHNSVSLQNTVSCGNSPNSVSTKHTVSWFYTMFQFYDLNILKLPKFPSYPKTYVANVHYISQCTLHSYYYNLMGPLSFILSVVDRNVVIRRMTVHSSRETAALISPCATTAQVKAVLLSRLQCCPEPHTAHYCEPVPVPVLIAGSCWRRWTLQTKITSCWTVPRRACCRSCDRRARW
jgi:hypothetical protein